MRSKILMPVRYHSKPGICKTISSHLDSLEVMVKIIQFLKSVKSLPFMFIIFKLLISRITYIWSAEALDVQNKVSSKFFTCMTNFKKNLNLLLTCIEF